MGVQINDAGRRRADERLRRDPGRRRRRASCAGVRTTRGGVVIRPNDFNPERIILDDVLRATPDVDVRDALHRPRARGWSTTTSGTSSSSSRTCSTPVDGGLTREVTTAPEPARARAWGRSTSRTSIRPTRPRSSPQLAGADRQRTCARRTCWRSRRSRTTPARAKDPSIDADASRWQHADLARSRPRAGRHTSTGRSTRWSTRTAASRAGTSGRASSSAPTAGSRSSTAPAATPRRRTRSSTPSRAPELTATARAASTRRTRRSPTAASRWPASSLWQGQKFFAIANHFNSKGGDDPLFGRFQPPVRRSEVQRHQQAAIVNDFVDDMLAVDHNGEGHRARGHQRLRVLGDDVDPRERRRPDEPLRRRCRSTSATRYVFEGNSQVLDQILVSPKLLQRLEGYDSVHVNSEFHDQDSDHDPQVARFRALGRQRRLNWTGQGHPWERVK